MAQTLPTKLYHLCMPEPPIVLSVHFSIPVLAQLLRPGAVVSSQYVSGSLLLTSILLRPFTSPKGF
jgi:hypothetical protein